MDILIMRAYEGYVQTPIQTLDGWYVNQPKHFLPLAKEAKRLAEEICKEKQAKQWAGILHEKLPDQSFLDQLNSLKYWNNWHHYNWPRNTFPPILFTF